MEPGALIELVMEVKMWKRVFTADFDSFRKGDVVYIIIYNHPLFPTIMKLTVSAHHRTQMAYKFPGGYLKFPNGKFFDKHRQRYTDQYVGSPEYAAKIIRTPNSEFELLWSKQNLIRKILRRTKRLAVRDRNAFVELLYEQLHVRKLQFGVVGPSTIEPKMRVYLHLLSLEQLRSMLDLLELKDRQPPIEALAAAA